VFSGAVAGASAASASAAVPERSRFPAMLVARTSDLTGARRIEFAYPDDRSPCVLAALGREADGGVGPDRDIVAFSTICPHMGCPLGSEVDEHECRIGPCVCHASAFDLARGGFQIQGHSAQPLAQVRLEVRGDEIWAVGIAGTLFGRLDSMVAS
jgi:arsenite oxidase small subunit